MASSLTSILKPCSASMRPTERICKRTTSAISCLVSGKNMMVSSIRLRNSGRMVCFSMSITFWRVSSKTSSRLASLRLAHCCWMYCEPRLDVMMMMVFLKFTVRPLLSVSLPSSSTCSRILNTSGCAFSISSKRTTL